jgi:prephenate dehydrogenase
MSPEPLRFNRIAIAGLGLMGGSLARALKRLPDSPHISAISRHPEEIRGGLDAGVIDEEPSGKEQFLREIDLLVYATPLEATLSLMATHEPFLPTTAAVTDVVSLKGPVIARAEELGLRDRFVGSHPMVGGTGTGFEHSSESLYRGARIWLVSGSKGGGPHLERIRAFWLDLGSRPAEIAAHEHDELMTWVSHLPQLTSNALALALKRRGLAHGHLGSGGRDMTRLAGSGPEMWRDLLAAAPGSLPRALEAAEEALAEVRELLSSGDLDGITERMRETRGWVGVDP